MRSTFVASIRAAKSRFMVVLPSGVGGFRHIAPQQSRKFPGNHRTTEIVPLPLWTAVLLKEYELLLCFHTFRYDPHMQTFPHADHRADDTGVVGIRSEVAHERLV